MIFYIFSLLVYKPTCNQSKLSHIQDICCLPTFILNSLLLRTNNSRIKFTVLSISGCHGNVTFHPTLSLYLYHTHTLSLLQSFQHSNTALTHRYAHARTHDMLCAQAHESTPLVTVKPHWHKCGVGGYRGSHGRQSLEARWARRETPRLGLRWRLLFFWIKFGVLLAPPGRWGVATANSAPFWQWARHRSSSTPRFLGSVVEKKRRERRFRYP